MGGETMSAMLELQSIRKTHQRGLLATEALRGVSLEVERGEFVSIMGPSGSGKTTLLNVMGLLEPFDGGSYRLGGVEVSGLSDADAAALRNRALGFVFQSYNLIPDLDVHDNLELPLRYRGIAAPERKKAVQRALERVEMTARRNHLPSELSGGQQQRVAIARALIGEPQVMLCDEPTGNLDTAMARQIVGLLESFHKAGTTIVLVTHASELAARAQRTVHLVDGRLIDPRPRRASA
jgi:putative ABC transport system ATP-binding protein